MLPNFCHESFIWRRQEDALTWDDGRIFVGAGLLAKAVGQLASMSDGLPPSRASLAPTGDLGWVQGLCLPQMLCGSGLARESGGSACIDVGWAAAIAGKPCSHRGLGWVQGLCPPQMLCGSELAHESGGSVCIDVGWAAAIAGKPCSHRGLGWVQGLCLPQMLCGSGLARESGGSACIDVGWAAAIAGKPCSHRGIGCWR